MTPFRSEKLPNGVSVAFIDRSNRYFGDYHRVLVEARISVPVAGREEPLVQARSLERMGVAGSEVTTVRDRLADDFWRHAAGYLGRPDYPARLQTAAAAPRRRSPLISLVHGY